MKGKCHNVLPPLLLGTLTYYANEFTVTNPNDNSSKVVSNFSFKLYSHIENRYTDDNYVGLRVCVDQNGTSYLVGVNRKILESNFYETCSIIQNHLHWLQLDIFYNISDGIYGVWLVSQKRRLKSSGRIQYPVLNLGQQYFLLEKFGWAKENCEVFLNKKTGIIDVNGQVKEHPKCIFIKNIFGANCPIEELDFEDGGWDTYYNKFQPPFAPCDLRDNSEIGNVYILLQGLAIELQHAVLYRYSEGSLPIVSLLSKLVSKGKTCMILSVLATFSSPQNMFDSSTHPRTLAKTISFSDLIISCDDVKRSEEQQAVDSFDGSVYVTSKLKQQKLGTTLSSSNNVGTGTMSARAKSRVYNIVIGGIPDAQDVDARDKEPVEANEGPVDPDEMHRRFMSSKAHTRAVNEKMRPVIRGRSTAISFFNGNKDARDKRAYRLIGPFFQGEERVVKTLKIGPSGVFKVMELLRRGGLGDTFDLDLWTTWFTTGFIPSFKMLFSGPVDVISVVTEETVISKFFEEVLDVINTKQVSRADPAWKHRHVNLTLEDGGIHITVASTSTNNQVIKTSQGCLSHPKNNFKRVIADHGGFAGDQRQFLRDDMVGSVVMTNNSKTKRACGYPFDALPQDLKDGYLVHYQEQYDYILNERHQTEGGTEEVDQDEVLDDERDEVDDEQDEIRDDGQDEVRGDEHPVDFLDDAMDAVRRNASRRIESSPELEAIAVRRHASRRIESSPELEAIDRRRRSLTFSRENSSKSSDQDGDGDEGSEEDEDDSTFTTNSTNVLANAPNLSRFRMATSKPTTPTTPTPTNRANLITTPTPTIPTPTPTTPTPHTPTPRHPSSPYISRPGVYVPSSRGIFPLRTNKSGEPGSPSSSQVARLGTPPLPQQPSRLGGHVPQSFPPSARLGVPPQLQQHSRLEGPENPTSQQLSGARIGSHVPPFPPSARLGVPPQLQQHSRLERPANPTSQQLSGARIGSPLKFGSPASSPRMNRFRASPLARLGVPSVPQQPLGHVPPSFPPPARLRAPTQLQQQSRLEGPTNPSSPRLSGARIESPLKFGSPASSPRMDRFPASPLASMGVSTTSNRLATLGNSVRVSLVSPSSAETTVGVTSSSSQQVPKIAEPGDKSSPKKIRVEAPPSKAVATDLRRSTRQGGKRQNSRPTSSPPPLKRKQTEDKSKQKKVTVAVEEHLPESSGPSEQSKEHVEAENLYYEGQLIWARSFPYKFWPAVVLNKYRPKDIKYKNRIWVNWLGHASQGAVLPGKTRIYEPIEVLKSKNIDIKDFTPAASEGKEGPERFKEAVSMADEQYYSQPETGRSNEDHMKSFVLSDPESEQGRMSSSPSQEPSLLVSITSDKTSTWENITQSDDAPHLNLTSPHLNLTSRPSLPLGTSPLQFYPVEWGEDEGTKMTSPSPLKSVKDDHHGTSEDQSSDDLDAPGGCKMCQTVVHLAKGERRDRTCLHKIKMMRYRQDKNLLYNPEGKHYHLFRISIPKWMFPNPDNTVEEDNVDKDLVAPILEFFNELHRQVKPQLDINRDKQCDNNSSHESPDVQQLLRCPDEKKAVRRSERQPASILLKAETDRIIEQLRIEHDNNRGLKIEPFPGKGRGIVTTKDRKKREFVLEYAGKLLTINSANQRESEYSLDVTKGCYMFYFQHQSMQYCVDATEETERMGRLVNHSRKHPNLLTKVIVVDNIPRLYFVAKDNIAAGTELLFDYGDRDKDNIMAHPWLAL